MTPCVAARCGVSVLLMVVAGGLLGECRQSEVVRLCFVCTLPVMLHTQRMYGSSCSPVRACLWTRL